MFYHTDIRLTMHGLDFFNLFTFTPQHYLHSITDFLRLSPLADLAECESPLKHFKSRCQNKIINKVYDQWHSQIQGDLLVYIRT